MSSIESSRTPRNGILRTPERALFLDELRNRPDYLAVLGGIAHANITTSSGESTVAGAIFDAGIRALRDEIANLSYAEEAADSEHQREAAAMKRRPRGQPL